MNKSIEPISAYVVTEYLYDGEQNNERPFYTTCEIVGISSYLNQPLTFHILIDHSYIYSNIPIIALVRKDILIPHEYTLHDLSYSKCTSLDIDVFTLSIEPTKGTVYFPRLQKWEVWEYCFSCDFYSWNDLLHLVKMSSWLFARVPNHKITFATNTFLPDYKKCHRERTR